jgi:predicted membrane chloride channel (bestrophin family)
LSFMCDAGELLVFAWNCTSSMNVGSTPSQLNAIGLTVYVFFRNPKPN